MKEDNQKIKAKMYLWFLPLILLWFFFPLDSAYAYLDPGSGSLLLQLLLGGFAGLAVVAKLYWTQLKEYFLKLFGGKIDQKPDDD